MTELQDAGMYVRLKVHIWHSDT